MLLNLSSKAPGRTGLKKQTDNLPPGGALPGPKIYCIFNVYLLWIVKKKKKVCSNTNQKLGSMQFFV